MNEEFVVIEGGEKKLSSIGDCIRRCSNAAEHPYVEINRILVKNLYVDAKLGITT